MERGSRNLSDGRVLYTSEDRLLTQMFNWMASLAGSHDSERSLDFLRVIVTKQRETLLEADRAREYGRVASRIALFDAMFPFSIFDRLALQAQERQAVRGWLETTLEERRKVQGLDPDIARHTRRDESLLARFSQPAQR
jgi:hypothetical protein